MLRPISFITYIVCAFVPVTSRAARDNGSSYAKVADMSEKKPPSANPDSQQSSQAFESLHSEQGTSADDLPAPPESTVFRGQDSIAPFIHPCHFII
jgi:hypothetical protein